MNLNNLINKNSKIAEDISDASYVLYVNGKEATKYRDEVSAKMDARLLKKKFPSNRIELRKVSCSTTAVEGKGDSDNTSIKDPELLSIIKFAKNHYPGSKSDEEALDKFIIHSLKHAEKTDRRQDSTLNNQDSHIDKLSAEIDNLQTMIYSIKNRSATENVKNTKENSCWKNYKRVGVKKKNGKTVPNCVPVGEDIQRQMSSFIRLLESKNTRK